MAGLRFSYAPKFMDKPNGIAERALTVVMKTEILTQKDKEI